MSSKKMIRATEEKKTTQDEELFRSFLDQIYSITLISAEELADYYDSFKYIGFNRMETLHQLYEVSQDAKIATQLIILCALRGPVAASTIKLKNGKTPQQMGIPASGGKGTKKITCARITSATADMAAYYMKKLNVPKRIADHECPAWLQFPAAGSIKLPENLRVLQRDFSIKFSSVIKGNFNQDIYSTMMSNAYLDERIGLFD